MERSLLGILTNLSVTYWLIVVLLGGMLIVGLRNRRLFRSRSLRKWIEYFGNVDLR